MIGDAILQRIGVPIMGWSTVNYIAAASCRLALARQACLYEGTKANAGCRDRLPVGAKQAVEDEQGRVAFAAEVAMRENGHGLCHCEPLPCMAIPTFRRP